MPLIILKSRILITSGLLVSLLCSAFVLLGNPTIAHAATCSSETAFKMVVKTDNPGTSNNQSFTIPTTGAGYNYTVDINGNDNWSDTIGAFDESTLRTGNTTIDFGSPGTYTIAICGDFPRIFFNNSGDKDKLLDITQWGDNPWTSMDRAFNGAANMDVTATDIPDLSGVTNMNSMFDSASSLVGNPSFNDWDTSSVTHMRMVFNNAAVFNQPIGGWNTANVTDMEKMFAGFDASGMVINGLDITGVVSAVPMAFNQDISGWDTGNVTNMADMFSTDVGSHVDFLNLLYGSIGYSVDVVVVGNPVRHSFNQSLANWDMSSIDPDPLGYSGFGITITGASGMFSHSSMSTDNYDATLTGWVDQSLQSGVVLGAHSLTYCNSDQARQAILDQDWTIEGDALDCTNATQGESQDSDGATDSDTDTSDELAATGYSSYISMLLSAACL